MLNRANYDKRRTAIPWSRRFKISKARARLSKAEVIQIFKLRVCTDRTSKLQTALEVARTYCVNDKTVRDIWNGRTWAHETKHIDRDKEMSPSRLGRPKGHKDSKPRQRRSVGKCNLDSAIRQKAQKKSHHADGAFSKHGHLKRLNFFHFDIKTSLDREQTISDGDVAQHALSVLKAFHFARSSSSHFESIDTRLYAWDQDPTSSPEFHDPFQDDWVAAKQNLSQAGGFFNRTNI